MNEAQTKAFSRALFLLRRARQANPRLGLQPPAAEEIAAARATLERLNGLQIVEAIMANPALLGYLQP